MSTTVSFATSSDDDAALEAATDQHAALVGALATHVARTQAAASDASRTSTARPELVDWARHELLPHLAAAARHLYPAAHELVEGRALVAGLAQHQRTVGRLVDRIAAAASPAEVAALATALHTMVEVHVRVEDEILLPLLAAAPTVSLDGLLAAVATAHRSEVAAPAPAGTDDHACGCGEHDDDVPELDVRIVPHAIRHATVFGALAAVRPGRALDLIAPHDPLPLLAQIEQREPGAFTVDYLVRGPEAWRLRFLRRLT